MKRLIIAAAAVLAALSSCCPAAGPKVSGHIEGIDSGSLLFMYASDCESGTEKLDTVMLDNGHFEYTPPVDESGVLMIIDVAHFVDFIDIYMVPGEKAVIEGTMTCYTIGGSSFYRDMGEFKARTAEIDARKAELFRRLEAETAEPASDAGQDTDYAETDEAPSHELSFDFHGEERKIAEERDSAAIAYIRENPSKDFSAYLATEVGIKRFEEAYALLSRKAVNGAMARRLADRKLVIEGDEVRRQAMGTIAVGVEAPDFSLPSSTGEVFTLSECRGSWVLLDFWGTWCGWCCEGIPNVRKVSETYAGKLRVVSVDTGDSETKWREGIEKFGMTWTQVYNSKADAVESRYAVEGFPGFYLIDPEGVIRMISFGEPHDFVATVGKYIGEE